MGCACEGGLMAGRRYVPLPLRPKLVRCFHFPLPSPLRDPPLFNTPSLSLCISHPLSHPLARSVSLFFTSSTVSRSLSYCTSPTSSRRCPPLFLFFVPRFFFFLSCMYLMCVCALAADDFFPLLSFPASFVLYGFPERETFSTHIKNSTHTQRRSQYFT